MTRLCGALLAVIAVLVAGGCGGGNEAASTTTTATTTTAAGAQTEVRVYWLRGGKVWPVRRQVASDVVATGALAELLRGPSGREKTDLKAMTAVPADVTNTELDIADGTARVSASGSLPHPAVCQVVYTLTQFPDVKSVALQGAKYTRKTCEDVTPSILVESPLPLDEVKSPLHANGTANTFEATFDYEVTDPDGKVVAKNFVMATSGTGTRGTFDFTTKAFEVPFDGTGELVVFERSAENGQRIHVVEVPLRMSKG
jgi:germination protein M